ncbi:MAG: GNAT family N-acetyltransferase, partial [Anaerolineaceae bacterium]
VQDVSPDMWEMDGNQAPFSSYQWYTFCEKVMADCIPTHILLLKDGKTHARGSFWLMHNDVLPIASPIGRAAARWLMRKRPVLVCRSPIANATGLVLSDHDHREALAGILSAAGTYAHQRHASFVIYDYLDAQQTRGGDFPGRYWSMQVDAPGTRLDIQWNTFEDYLASLSKHARKDYRRHMNQATRTGIRMQARCTITDGLAAVERIRQVERRHGTMPNPWIENILNNFQMVGGIWLEASQDDRLIGCGLLLPDGDQLVATLFGLDYEVKYAYFPLIYGAIKVAIEQGVRLFYAGSGAYELKRRLGFTLENNNYIRITGLGPIFSTAVRLIHRKPVKEGYFIEEGNEC